MRTIKSFNKRLEMLRSERSSYMDYWRELSDQHLAHRGRFLSSDRNKGHKRNTKQFNNTSRRATRTLASGMMAGITSPARPWFKLQAPDSSLNQDQDVKRYLHDVEVIMRSVFAQSNLYNALYSIYSEFGVFGTAALGAFDDFENVVWFKPFTVGSYMLGMDGQNRINTMYREYELTVAQLISEFGIDRVSPSVRRLHERGVTEEWIKVVHAIEPNDDRDSTNPLAKHKLYRSVYYEASQSKGLSAEQFLRESGFDNFPILAPRWAVTGEDVYASDCPGMTALGDTKSLQLGERRMWQAIDKVANPPTQAPSNMRNKLQGIQSGETVYVDDTGQGVRSIYDYRPDLNALQSKLFSVEDRVEKAFYVDLFLMLANDTRSNVTAREISERHEEKLLMLGPVLNQLNSELLDPLIDVTFSRLQRAGILPQAPDALQNTELKVEYISVLAQAQKMVSISAIERGAQFAASLSSAWPEARHKFNALEAVDDYNDAVGVNPKITRSDKEVEALIKAEQEAAAQEKQLENISNLVNVGETASNIDTGSHNAVTDVMRTAGLQQQN